MPSPADRPRPTLARQLRAVGVLVLIVLVLAGGAYGTWWIFVGRPVLSGDRSFDFGVVPYTGEPVKVAHTFVLHNHGHRAVEIRDIRTTCGCAAADPSVRVLEPGAAVEVAATLMLKKEGIKTARIILLYDDGSRRDTLHVRAAAQIPERLGFQAGPALLGPGKPLERFLVYLDYDSNRRPPAPRITVPQGVAAEFTSWTQTAQRERSKGLPARWKGAMRIRLTGDTLPEGATVVVQVGADQKVELPLRSE